jgi:hypothetical protein
VTRAPRPPLTLTPPPPRPYRLQIMADKALVEWLESKRGKGRRKLSLSETGYLLLCHLRDADTAPPPEPITPERREGARRLTDSAPDSVAA